MRQVKKSKKIGGESVSWTVTEQPYGKLIRNENGKDLGIGGDVPMIEQDGFAFKDLARTGELLPYEDWRLDPKTRAEDLAGRLSREEIAGLMLYSSHQIVPFPAGGPFSDKYGGEDFDPDRHAASDLSDGQISMLKQDHIRHVLQMSVKSARVSAEWSNNLQKVCESEPWGIPVNISGTGAPDRSEHGTPVDAAGGYAGQRSGKGHSDGQSILRRYADHGRQPGRLGEGQRHHHGQALAGRRDRGRRKGRALSLWLFCGISRRAV